MNDSRLDKLQKIYILEKHRINSFKEWPFDENSSCSINNMAEAGFYWCGNSKDNDAVTCFVCGKVLHGWEPTDEPWKEHAKHAPQCQFVKYGQKELDLTLGEFIDIFNIVVRSKMIRNFDIIKNRFIKNATNHLKSFQGEK